MKSTVVMDRCQLPIISSLKDIETPVEVAALMQKGRVEIVVPPCCEQLRPALDSLLSTGRENSLVPKLLYPSVAPRTPEVDEPTRVPMCNNRDDPFSHAFRGLDLKWRPQLDSYVGWMACKRLSSGPPDVQSGKNEHGDLMPTEGGVLTYSDGSTYVGYAKGGIPNGIGQVGTGTYPTADAYMFSPVLKHDGRTHYVGEFENGLFHGKGAFLWPNGDRYLGFWKSGIKHGFGVLVKSYNDSSIYSLKYPKLRDSRHKAFEAYIGYWEDNKYHGTGVYVSRSGSHYDGSWSGGRYHGVGRVILKNGDIHAGFFSYGQAQGFGYRSYHDDNNQLLGEYKGEFSKGERQGLGQFCWSGGASYFGQFEDGSIERFSLSAKSRSLGRFLRLPEDTPIQVFDDAQVPAKH